ncbi:unnamed protein product, partial [marine sediment metagenome]
MNARIHRFWKNWMIVSAPILYLAWAAGRAMVFQHAYKARDLPVLSDFIVRKFLEQGMAVGLTFGFWCALLIFRGQDRLG